MEHKLVNWEPTDHSQWSSPELPPQISSSSEMATSITWKTATEEMPTKRTACNRCFKESNILWNWSKAFRVFLFQVVPTSKIEITSPGGFKFQSRLKIWRMEVRTKCVCRHKFVFLSYFISTIWKEEYTLVRFLDVSELYLIQFIFL